MRARTLAPCTYPTAAQPLTLFTCIVETGSFSRAAAGIDIPRHTTTNAIKKPETRLGVRLLERTTRQVRPTLDGQAFYDRCVHVLARIGANLPRTHELSQTFPPTLPAGLSARDFCLKHHRVPASTSSPSFHRRACLRLYWP